MTSSPAEVATSATSSRQIPSPGFATEMLRQAAEVAHVEGLSRLPLTCDDNNTGSATVVERYGGVLETAANDDGGVLRRRCWIERSPDREATRGRGPSPTQDAPVDCTPTRREFAPLLAGNGALHSSFTWPAVSMTSPFAC